MAKYKLINSHMVTIMLLTFLTALYRAEKNEAKNILEV